MEWPPSPRPDPAEPPAGSPPRPAAAATRRARPRPGRTRLERGSTLDTRRVATLIGRLFYTSYTLRGVSYLLHRIGYTP
ncbi:winged helix-turn-helix domain-containing protein [Micromonospora sp. LOL_015]|uniref:winged helix-turn-helix domain-containing protein n=1 Tax=Micromonospora sp. LOL_015 TaxID=3345416 RepID=UPI003A885B85